MHNADQAHARTLQPAGGYPAILAGCRTPSVRDNCRQVVDDCLGHLDDQLRKQRATTDRRSVRQTLRELAELIAGDQLGLARGDYQRLLARLAATFATGLGPSSEGVLAAMAPNYAGVVAAVSRACPSCDYEAPLGQLLTYMARLFLDRRSGWKSIYRSIRSMSDGVAAKRRLDEVELSRIEEWIESGAANLFPIQRDLARAIARLEDELAAVDAEIARRAKAAQLPLRLQATDGDLVNVVLLDVWLQRRETAKLQRQRLDLLGRLEAKQGVKELIDSDIRELEDSLHATRRAYFIRLAWSAA